jgi:hypothetical protein
MTSTPRRSEEGVVKIEEARKLLEEAEAAWAARPWDTERQRKRQEARALLARVQREAEGQGQLTLTEEDTGDGP